MTPIWRNTSLNNLQEIVDGILITEEWRCIGGFPYYMVSSFGRVKSLPKLKIRSKRSGSFVTKEKVVKQTVLNLYPFVSLCEDGTGKIYTKNVHRLVAKAFINNPENKPQVNHKKGIKTDNRVANLEWCTISENRKHAYDNGLQSKVGVKHHLAKLDDMKVIQIRGMSLGGIRNCEIAKAFGIAQQTVNNILKGRRWRHVEV